MRLWSTVVSQLTTRPSFHVGASVSLRTAIRRSFPEGLVRPYVRHERVELNRDPAAADRRHVALDVGRVLSVVDHELAERAAVQERSVPGDRRPYVTLALEAVALRAGALPRLAAELLGRFRDGLLPRPAIELGGADHFDPRVHHRVLDPAVLRAPPLVGPFLLRSEAELVDPAGERVLLPGQRGDPPAVVDVERRDLEDDGRVDGQAQRVDRDGAVLVLVL